MTNMKQTNMSQTFLFADLWHVIALVVTFALCVSVAAPAMATERNQSASNQPVSQKRSDVSDPHSHLMKNEILVSYKRSASAPRVPTLRMNQKSVVTSGDVTTAVASTQGQDISQALRKARSTPGVIAAQPNFVYRQDQPIPESSVQGKKQRNDISSSISEESASGVSEQEMPTDPLARVRNSSESPNEYWFYASNFPPAWDVAKADHARGQRHRVTVALLDSAVQTNHQDLAANMLPSFDAVGETYKNADEGSKETPVTWESDNHGTRLAGIISAVANNGIGLAGASHNASVLPISVMYSTDQGSSSDTMVLHTALQHVRDLVEHGNPLNIRVVNMSLAFDNFSKDEGSADPLVLKDITALRNDGVVSVCSGGNSKGKAHVYPADEPQSVSVTALTQDGYESSYSGYNKDKDISAPGDGIWSTVPGSSCAWGGSNDSCYNAENGTSFSAPIVSAALALLFAEKPAITVDQALQAIYQTAGPIHYSESASDQERESINGTHGSLDAGSAAHFLAYVLNQYKGYRDVIRNQWYTWPVAYSAWKGYMNGYSASAPDGTTNFGPNDPVTRAQAATLIWRYKVGSATARRLSSGGAALSCASHVRRLYRSDGRSVPLWAACAVDWAHDRGVMTGFRGTPNFDPNAPLKREEAAKVMAKAANANLSNLVSSAWARYQALKNNAVTEGLMRETVWAVGARVLNGFDNSDGTANLDATGQVSRAQMAHMMQNAINKKII